MKRRKRSGNRRVERITASEFIEDWVYRIDLDADYQREKIWSTKNQKCLLDSILRDIDIPKLYIVKVEDNAPFEFDCIDGKQRMSTLLRFFRPEPKEEAPLTVRHLEKEYTYKKLKAQHPTVAKIIEDYELTFTIYDALDDGLIREIFRRLQLGIRLNSGELLKSRTGTIRDFIYKEIGNDGPFFRKTELSRRRFSQPFTLAQICINSFNVAETDGGFVRARLQDIEEFFDKNHNIEKNDPNLTRIRKVLKLMDKAFDEAGSEISSRAVAVSAYLYAEELVQKGQAKRLATFARFYAKLLDGIRDDLSRIRNYEAPLNSVLMDQFQKYITQASVEAYSIRRRHDFIDKAFKYYLAPKTKGKLLGSKE